MEQMLIPRYPGAKSNRNKYPVWDGRTYAQAVIPFAGSGRWSIPALQKGHVRSLTVADADPAVRAVWREFTTRPWGLSQRVERWLDILKDWADHQSKDDYAKEVFQKLCEIHDSFGYGFDEDGQSFHRYDYAAAKILLHKLCFGGNVRSNAQGKLNISLRKDWADAVHDWYYELPWCPPSREVKIHADWSECFGRQSADEVIAFVDPPYYAPGNSPRVKGGMSKAYSVHGGNPNDAAVLEMFKGAVEAAINSGCDRIVATNYWGHWLQTIEHTDQWSQPKIIDSQWVEYEETTQFMRSMGFEWFHDLGSLQSMNNINFNAAKAGMTEQRTIRHEGWWELGGVRQHGRVHQMSLLEVAA